jgi:hypothetical protein
MTPERAARRLTDLLAREREAAQAGDLAALSALAEEKAALSRQVEEGLARGAYETGAAAVALRRLSEALREGEALIRAVLEGVRSARGRIEAARRAADPPMRTYGPDGAPGVIARAKPGRRA